MDGDERQDVDQREHCEEGAEAGIARGRDRDVAPEQQQDRHRVDRALRRQVLRSFERCVDGVDQGKQRGEGKESA
jgi:hypothetical protein